MILKTDFMNPVVIRNDKLQYMIPRINIKIGNDNVNMH